jgi:hypothetical protein
LILNDANVIYTKDQSLYEGVTREQTGSHQLSHAQAKFIKGSDDISKKSISIGAKGYGEKKVNKSTQGMPWLSEAMKDVISCDKHWGLANMN